METNESHNEASIEIIRKDGVVSSVKVIMPAWCKINDDGTLKVEIPLFKITTFADNEEDAHEAIKEAIMCFCISAQKFGNGLEQELKELGWTSETSAESNHSLFNINSNAPFIEDLMNTGESMALDLQLA